MGSCVVLSPKKRTTCEGGGKGEFSQAFFTSLWVLKQGEGGGKIRSCANIIGLFGDAPTGLRKRIWGGGEKKTTPLKCLDPCLRQV